MRIGMIVHGMNDFGGMEEIATTLAVGLKHQGHDTCFVSTSWAPASNQYIRRLRQSNVPFVQPPKWLSLLVSDWPTKERILARAVWLCSPLVFLLAGMLVLKGRSWGSSQVSARGWVRRQLMDRLIAPDRREAPVRLLLAWWNFRWRPDLLHFHGYMEGTSEGSLFVIDWANARGLPVVYQEHQTPDSDFYKEHQTPGSRFQRSVNKAALVIAVSEASARALHAVCGVSRPMAVAVPIVSDPACANGRETSTVGSADGQIRVSTVARLYATKGLTYLLDAIAEVKEAHPTVNFRVYGDGPMHEELLARAGQLGLDGNLIFAGAFNHEDLPLIMAQTDIFVMSSVLEGLPVAIIEAMSYGRPIVATPVGGIPELIDDGVNGLLCAPRDARGLAQKIISLVDDAGLRKRLGSSARQSYELGPFQPAAVCDHVVSIYGEVLRSPKPAFNP